MWVARLRGMRRLHGLHPAPDGRWLAVGGPHGGCLSAAVWASPGRSEQAAGVGGAAYAVAPDFAELLAAPRGHIGFDCRFDLRSGAVRPLPVEPWATGPQVLAAAFSPSGHLVAVLENGPADGWDRTNRLVVRAAESWAGHGLSADLGQAYGGVCWHPAGNRLAVFACRQGGSGLAEFEPVGRPVGLPLYSRNIVRVAGYSPCGRWLVAAIGRGLVRLADSRYLTAFGTAPRPQTALAFAPDGRLLTASADGVARTWDVAAGRQVGEFAPGVGPLHAVAVAPDGLTAAAGGSNAVVVWDL